MLPTIQPRRTITGMSAILLPFTPDGAVDWPSFAAHAKRTFEAGLAPAVNMDTGYANLIDEATRERALAETHALAAGRRYVAGAFIADRPNDAFALERYAEQMALIEKYGGTPVVMQSYGLAHQAPSAIVENYRQLAKVCKEFIAFELGQVFAPFGAIYDLDTYEQLMRIENCLGAKHSSLHRQPEWDRLALRDRTRKDFMVLTGNDLAIDMVMYGSDYLLGLSTFAPEAFALRDAYWRDGDPRFYELNDLLQYLGCFAFRAPTPAYKHDAAMFLHQRGWLTSDRTHPKSAARPASDREVLAEILVTLNQLTEE